MAHHTTSPNRFPSASRSILAAIASRCSTAARDRSISPPAIETLAVAIDTASGLIDDAEDRWTIRQAARALRNARNATETATVLRIAAAILRSPNS